MAIPTDARQVSAALYFNANGGSGAPTAQYNSAWVNQASGYSLGVWTTTTIPTKTGYDFVGWNQNSSATTGLGSNDYFYFYFPPSTSAQSQGTTVYAIWKAKTYTVSYNANGGSGAPSNQTKTYGVNLTLSSTVPTRANYNFKGWATSASGSVAYQPGGTYSANATVTLYAVWEVAAAPLTSVSNTEIGSSGTASWTKMNNSHSYKLVLTCGSAPAVTVNVAANSSSTSFTIPNTWLNYVTNSTTATATATLTTYSGSTSLGSSSKTFTVSVPSGVKPTISSFTASHYSANATVSGWGVFTQGFSKADLSVIATAGTGASISSISFTGTSINTSGTATTARTGIIDAYGTVTFTVKVTDSRGRSATSTVSVTVQPYAAPVVISIGTMRADADGTTNNSTGAYLKVLPIYSLSSVDGHNSFTAQTLSYYAHGSGTPLASISCVSSTTYGPPDNLWAINLADTYDVAISVTDSLGSTTTIKTTLPGASGIWYDRENNALGLGAPPSRANLFSCDWDAEFHGTVDVTPRRCWATLSSSGWYRLMKYEAANASDVVGLTAFVVDFSLLRRYANNPNEAHKISLFANYNSIEFLNEVSKSLSVGIDKIRYTYNGTNGYVDIHYSLSASNFVSCDFTVHAPMYQGRFTAEFLQSVADAPTGETVLTTYDFFANSDVAPFKFTVGGKDWWFEKRDGVVYFNSPYDITSVSAGSTAIGTLPVGFRPRIHMYLPCGNNYTQFQMVTITTNGNVSFYTNTATSTARNCAFSGSWVAYS
jgi:uncharacterized repeat protein (TIGR02543 family)